MNPCLHTLFLSFLLHTIEQREITHLTASEEQLQEFLREARSNIKDLSRDVEERTENVARLTAERDQLRSDLTKATSTHAELAQTHTTLLASHVREVDHLKASMDCLEQACRREQEEMRQRNEKITTLTRELALLEGKLEAANAQAARFEAQITDLQEQGRTLNTAREQAAKTVEAERLAHKAMIQQYVVIHAWLSDS